MANSYTAADGSYNRYRRRRSDLLRMIWLIVTGITLPVRAAPSPEVTMEQASRAALAAVAQCAKDGYHVSAAVVDRGGVLLALLRSGAAGPHTVDSSRKKAYTAASLRESTAKLAALVAEEPELQGLRDMNDSMLMLGGGLPVRIDGAVAGGIGVGGAPGASLDEACARAGLAVLEQAAGTE